MSASVIAEARSRAPTRAHGAAHQRGEVIADKYVLGDVLGAGGMGIVYLASHTSLDRIVALKLVRPELDTVPDVVRRFRSEALAGSRLSHPNVVSVFDFGSTPDGLMYLVMEHVCGQSLAQLVAEHGPMSLRRAADLIGQLLAALDEAHDGGVIHCDVKSDNVLVQLRRDGTEIAKLIDFGLARFVDDPAPITGDSMLSGTPEYLAPEVIGGASPSPASDIYAAGVILYELIAGTTPFGGGTSNEILARHLDEDVVPPSLRCPDRQVPADLERVVMRALDKDPAKRFPSAVAFAAALAAATPATEPAALATSPTLPNLFRTEAPTRDWSHSEIAAVGSRRIPTMPGADASVPDLRAAVGRAITAGDVDAIVVAYLDLARALIDDHRLLLATTELEQAVELLRGETSARTSAPIWRLLLSLAALYDGLGDPSRARQAAFAGRDDAVRVSDIVGQDRARALIERMVHGERSRPTHG